jgi:hypothetical protein
MAPRLVFLGWFAYYQFGMGYRKPFIEPMWQWFA